MQSRMSEFLKIEFKKDRNHLTKFSDTINYTDLKDGVFRQRIDKKETNVNGMPLKN